MKYTMPILMNQGQAIYNIHNNSTMNTTNTMNTHTHTHIYIYTAQCKTTSNVININIYNTRRTLI